MDRKSMGTFLTDLRKEKGLTQQEVADNLNVSNKTISKWERDEGYPEITMLPEIARFYEITTDELLNGEKVPRKIEDDINEIACIANNGRFSGLIYGLRVLGVMSPVMIAILSVIINFLDFGFSRTLAHYVIYSVTALSVVWFVVSLFVGLKKVDKDSLAETKALKTIGVTFFFMLMSVFFVILLTIDECQGNYISPYFYLIPSTLFSIIATFVFGLIFKRKFNFEASIKTNKKLIKKLVTVAVILTILTSILATVFIIDDSKALNTALVEYTVDFINDGMYSSKEEAISDYTKIKKLFTDDSTRIFSIQSENGNELILSEIHVDSEKVGDSYSVTEIFSTGEEMGFFTREEMELFIQESVVSDVVYDFIYSMEEDIVFDDDNYTVSFNELGQAERITTVVSFYFVIASGALSALYIVLFIYYNKKKIRV